MPIEQHNNPDDLLDRAAAALRDSAVPDGPAETLMAQTLARLQTPASQPLRIVADEFDDADETESQSIPISRARARNIARLSRLAAAAVFLIAMSGLAYWLLRPSSLLARVVDRVREARNVAFKATTTVKGPDGKEQQVLAEIVIVDPSSMRQNIEPDGPDIILDLSAQKVLFLYPQLRQAVPMAMKDMPPDERMPNILEAIRNLDPGSGVSIGEKKIGGHTAKGVRVSRPEGEMTIWIDPPTHLPVEVQMPWAVGAAPPKQIRATDFRWDTSINENLLKLTPPPGYVVHSVNLSMAPLGEQDVIEAMKALSEFNHGRLPPGLDADSFAAMMPNVGGLMPADPNSLQWKQQQAHLLELMPVIARGWFVIMDPNLGSDWRYAGADVQLGAKGVPVLWYRPAGRALYRVIDADMSVHEVSEEDLPKVKATKIVNPLRLTTRPAG